MNTVNISAASLDTAAAILGLNKTYAQAYNTLTISAEYAEIKQATLDEYNAVKSWISSVRLTENNFETFKNLCEKALKALNDFMPIANENDKEQAENGIYNVEYILESNKRILEKNKIIEQRNAIRQNYKDAILTQANIFNALINESNAILIKIMTNKADQNDVFQLKNIENKIEAMIPNYIAALPDFDQEEESTRLTKKLKKIRANDKKTAKKHGFSY